MVISQVMPTPDPLGGWGHLILNGGAFALLIYIVIFLVPKLMREAREERAAAAKNAKDRDRLFQATIDTIQDRFTERTRDLLKGIEKQTEALLIGFASTLTKQMDKVRWILTSMQRGSNTEQEKDRGTKDPLSS
jgi:hypothetical protein